MLPAIATLTVEIEREAAVRIKPDNWTPVSGGDINAAFCVADEEEQRFFIKINHASRIDHFAAEAEGLDELSRANGPHVPRSHGYGTSDDQAWLLLDWLELTGSKQAAAETFGRALADMHRTTQDAFGWHRDNVIGSTPQTNQQEKDWVTFYGQHRLQAQLNLAADNGAPASLLNAGDRLMADLNHFFASYQPAPSLLHGDLWGGNWGVLADNTPAIFDPAVYFGDREADIAMTRLFGGFPEGFYAAYNEAWPLAADSTERIDLYNLYHVLNHYNLFGGGYAAQAEGMLGRLLSLI